MKKVMIIFFIFVEAYETFDWLERKHSQGNVFFYSVKNLGIKTTNYFYFEE